MSDTVAILSPHLDDAVLSCWHVLAGPAAVRVVNVFTGVPENGLGEWDRATGATDSARRMRERLEEDRAALHAVARPAVNVGLLDEQYRNGSEPASVYEAIAPLVAQGEIVYAPAGFGGHTDHVLVRDAGLALRDRGATVRLFADLPHAAAAGWPGWVAPNGTELKADGGWRAAFNDAGIEPDEPRATVHRLDHEALRRKLGALHCYATQLPVLLRSISLKSLRLEVTWTL
jgi:LmbE family N-acetylglucosaminyl deacetylase